MRPITAFIQLLNHPIFVAIVHSATQDIRLDSDKRSRISISRNLLSDLPLSPSGSFARFHWGGRVAQWAVTLASAPMGVGSIPALRVRDFWVPPCSALVFRHFHCGFVPSSLYSETLVSVLHFTSVAFTVLRAVPA